VTFPQSRKELFIDRNKGVYKQKGDEEMEKENI